MRGSRKLSQRGSNYEKFFFVFVFCYCFYYFFLFFFFSVDEGR